MKKIKTLLSSPRGKNYAMGAAAVALVLGSHALLSPDRMAGDRIHGGSYELAQSFAAPATAGRVMSKGMPHAAAIAADVAPQAGQTQRRVEETHSFTLTGERDRIPDHYEAAMEACAPAFCEILSGSLHEYGGTLEARVSMRVAPEQFDAVVAGAGVGSAHLDLVSHERSSQDRTRQYQDNAARLESQKALRDRLMTLLESPTTRKTSDILEIEREIARTQGEIEALDAQRRSIEAVTDRTTAHFTFRNDRLEGAPAHPPYLANAFKEAGTIFERSLAQLVKYTAGISPLVIFAGLVWLLLFRAAPAIWRRIRDWRG